MYQAQKGKGEKKGRKARKREKGKGAPAVRALFLYFLNYPLSPMPLHFSLPPYPLPISTPATQAKDVYRNQFVT